MAGNFEELHCWQACYNLKTYLKTNVLKKLPKIEKFELHAQILRAARSSTANIAEGWGRYHYKENINFYVFQEVQLLKFGIIALKQKIVII